MGLYGLIRADIVVVVAVVMRDPNVVGVDRVVGEIVRTYHDKKSNQVSSSSTSPISPKLQQNDHVI
jgi:hypothetical protein